MKWNRYWPRIFGLNVCGIFCNFFFRKIERKGLCWICVAFKTGGLVSVVSEERFLALLDSVSRGHGMGLLSVVRRPSVLPSVRGAIFSEPNARISFKFWLWLPLGHTPRRFFHF